METKKEFFQITSVSRDDIAALGYKGAENLSDGVMEKIAKKMADSYVDNQFWIDLECMVDTYCELEREKKTD